MAGKLVRFKSDDDGAAQHLIQMHHHDPSRYEVLREYSPHSDRAPNFTLAEVLRSAGVALDARSDTRRKLVPCREWAQSQGSGVGCKSLGDTYRVCSQR